jgi:dTDP-4-amino-4,6-dideoxygalactose transaminase
VLGKEVERFEAAWAAYCGAERAVGTANGTDALHLILLAARIGAGDEVIVPGLAAFWTPLAVSLAGARPVFADVDAADLTLAPAAFEAAITPQTAAVIAVHLYGCPADMGAIKAIAHRHDLLVIEDATQAHGATYEGQRAGALADVAAFDFHSTTNLGAYGDAGAVVTSDPKLAERVRMLRTGGQRRPFQYELLGANSRLDEMQAAVLLAKLPHLCAWNHRRQALAARYAEGLSDVDALQLPSVPQGREHVYSRYVVRTSLRDALGDYLAGAGVDTGVHYPRASYLQPAYASLGLEAGLCPQAESAADEVLTLPLFPQLSNHEQQRVIRLIRIFFAMR